MKVLNVPEELKYQLAFLSSEVREIFEKSPSPVLTDGAEADAEHPSNRKPLDHNDCPVCFDALDPSKEEILWCKAACGNSMWIPCEIRVRIDILRHPFHVLSDMEQITGRFGSSMRLLVCFDASAAYYSEWVLIKPAGRPGWTTDNPWHEPMLRKRKAR